MRKSKEKKKRERENGVVAAGGGEKGSWHLNEVEGIQGASCKIRSSRSVLIARESWHSGTSFEPVASRSNYVRFAGKWLLLLTGSIKRSTTFVHRLVATE